MVSEREIPRLLIDSFPEEKMQKYSFANGIVSFSNNGLTQLFLEI
jgi:CRISPR/Cas system CMR-associated protein Cmr3 (group 5 of RAMP superfamily)